MSVFRFATGFMDMLGHCVVPEKWSCKICLYLIGYLKIVAQAKPTRVWF